MADFGGEFFFNFSSGQKIIARGEVSVMPAGTSNESLTNQDGSVARGVTLTPHKAECTFEDSSGLDWETLMRERFNVTIREDFTGATHLFTNAFFEGEPSINRKNGEVSGLSISSGQYRRV